MKPPAKPLVLGLGEALYDCLPGRVALGGAPLNWAVHLHRLLDGDGRAGLISRVGEDDLGRQLIKTLDGYGLDTSAIQQDARHATGRVNVTLDHEGQPEYDIVADAAWDHIEATPDAIGLVEKCSAVCFGTLAQRSPSSRAAIMKLLDHAPQAIRMFDVNLRDAFDPTPVLAASLERCTVAKCNEHELPWVLTTLNLTGDAHEDHVAQAQRLRRTFCLRAVVVTRGSRGTLMVTEDSLSEGKPGKYDPTPNADSVGAGDACGAAIVFGMLKNWPHTRTASLANSLGANVASVAGATTHSVTRISCDV